MSIVPILHGGIVGGRFPQFPPLIDEVPSWTPPWLGLFGDLDDSIPVAEVEHRFHCDAGPSFNEAAATDGWTQTLSWFGARR